MQAKELHSHQHTAIIIKDLTLEHSGRSCELNFKVHLAQVDLSKKLSMRNN